jgi:hypothetical protein
MGIIYRAMLEMRTDISDLKKMLAKFSIQHLQTKDESIAQVPYPKH